MNLEIDMSLHKKSRHMIKLILTVAFSLILHNVLLSQSISDNLKIYKLTEVENEVGFKFYYRGDTLVSKEYNYGKRSFPFFRFKSLKEGIYYSYHPNGNIKEVGAYHKGEKIGFWQTFEEDGRLDTECMYSKKGKQIECKSHIDSETKINELIKKLDKKKE